MRAGKYGVAVCTLFPASASCLCFLPSGWISFLNPAFLALTLSSLVCYCPSDWHSISLFCSTWSDLLPWSLPQIGPVSRPTWVDLTSPVVWPGGDRGYTTAMQIVQNQMPVTRIPFLNVPLATAVPHGYFLFISSCVCFPFFVPSFSEGKTETLFISFCGVAQLIPSSFPSLQVQIQTIFCM